jgi:hypothetical protein
MLCKRCSVCGYETLRADWLDTLDCGHFAYTEGPEFDCPDCEGWGDTDKLAELRAELSR